MSVARRTLAFIQLEWDGVTRLGAGQEHVKRVHISESHQKIRHTYKDRYHLSYSIQPRTVHSPVHRSQVEQRDAEILRLDVWSQILAEYDKAERKQNAHMAEQLRRLEILRPARKVHTDVELMPQ